jgi:hypothetical protein
MHLAPRIKLSRNFFFIFALLTLVLIAPLPNGVVAQQENTWELKTPKTPPGTVYRAVDAGDKIYIYRNSFVCYDPSTNNYTKKTPLTLPFQGARRGDNLVYDAVALQMRSM